MLLALLGACSGPVVTEEATSTGAPPYIPEPSLAGCIQVMDFDYTGDGVSDGVETSLLLDEGLQLAGGWDWGDGGWSAWRQTYDSMDCPLDREYESVLVDSSVRSTLSASVYTCDALGNPVTHQGWTLSTNEDWESFSEFETTYVNAYENDLLVSVDAYSVTSSDSGQTASEYRRRWTWLDPVRVATFSLEQADEGGVYNAYHVAYFYDEQGLRASSETTDTLGYAEPGTHTYTWDALERMVRSTWDGGSDGELDSQYIYTHRDDDPFVDAYEYDSDMDGAYDWRYSYQYNCPG